MYKSNKFCDILEIGKGITAVIGSGGKTSLIGRLSTELSGRTSAEMSGITSAELSGKPAAEGMLCGQAGTCRVIFTTTTHILRPEDMPVACSERELVRLLSGDSAAGEQSLPDHSTACEQSLTDDNAACEQSLPDHIAADTRRLSGCRPAPRMVCVGSVAPDNPRKLSIPNIPMERLCIFADYVLVEADGSKMLPIKAHKSYEPVIPDKSDTVVLVVGLSGIGGQVLEKVHRTEEFARLTGAQPEDVVTPALIAKGIVAELPRYAGYTVRIYLNQTDIADGEMKAAQLAEAIRSELGTAAGMTDGDAAQSGGCSAVGWTQGASQETMTDGVPRIYAGSLKEGYIYRL